MPSPVGSGSLCPAHPGVRMCTRITLAPPETAPAYDADACVITVPADLPPSHRVTLVRAILTELVTEQPELGAICWCGEPVDLTPRIPHQRESEQVVTHGA